MNSLFALALLTLPVGLLTQEAKGPEPRPQIVVSGVGDVTVMPDRATIDFSVETRAKKAAEAAQANARIQKSVLAVLRDAGIAERDISTVGFDVQPEWRYDDRRNRELIGYAARNTIRVRLERLDRVGETIDLALGAGVNRVASIRFSVSDIDQARREALAEAVERARADAETLARAAGGELGPLIEISTEGPSLPLVAPTMMRAEAAAGAVETPITPGEQTVRATVHVRWEFREGR